MLKQKSIFNLALLFLFIFIIYFLYNINSKINKINNNTYEPFDYYNCTLNLKDIDTKVIDEYMKFDNRHVACGPCKNATLKMNILPCATNENGSQSPNCNQNASIVSSDGRPITFTSFVTLKNVKDFFCFE